MRAAGGVLAAIAIAGCGSGGGTASTAGVISASFANVNGANTSGVAMSATFAACDYGASAGLSCTGSEAAAGKGRVVTVSFDGAVVVGKDYVIGGAEGANVLFTDPTDFGTASGMRLWQALPGTGTVRVVQWDPGAMHVGFSYAASMRALGSPATGTFDLTGDGNVNSLTMRSQ